MNLFGANGRETLIGTARKDKITSLDGDDLIGTGGGGDIIKAGGGNDMIGGFQFDLGNLARSDNRGADVDGGTGYDTLVIELVAARRVSDLGKIHDVMEIKGVEEFIFSFATTRTGQQIRGTNAIETIVIGVGDANIDARGGDDYIFAGAGDDIITGGKGSDFIHAGNGRNTVSGGAGNDYFHFHLTGEFQYTIIEDFKAGEDKIRITLDVGQVNFLHETSYLAARPVRDYGDVVIGNGPEFNQYVSTSNGRWFDADDFDSDFDEFDFDNWARYEQDTGSIFVSYWVDVDGVNRELEVLVAHVKPGTVIDESDFAFRLI